MCFNIRWGSICLKSMQYPNIDACHQLPKVLKLRNNEVLCNKHAMIPLLWKNLQAHSVTKLYLENEEQIHILYSFDMFPEIDQII